eukprot:6868246-Prymnesium_polylepis.1
MLLVSYYDPFRVGRGASAMAARRRECEAHSVPARLAGEAAAAQRRPRSGGSGSGGGRPHWNRKK